MFKFEKENKHKTTKPVKTWAKSKQLRGMFGRKLEFKTQAVHKQNREMCWLSSQRQEHFREDRNEGPSTAVAFLPLQNPTARTNEDNSNRLHSAPRT